MFQQTRQTGSTSSGVCLVTEFGISSVHSLGSNTKVRYPFPVKYFTMTRIHLKLSHITFPYDSVFHCIKVKITSLSHFLTSKNQHAYVTSLTDFVAPIRDFIYHLTDNFFGSSPAHPNPLVRSIGSYSLADLHRQYKKYIHKQPKHLLL